MLRRVALSTASEPEVLWILMNDHYFIYFIVILALEGSVNLQSKRLCTDIYQEKKLECESDSLINTITLNHTYGLSLEPVWT